MQPTLFTLPKQRFWFDCTIKSRSCTQKVEIRKVDTEDISEIMVIFQTDMHRSLRLFSAIEAKKPAE